jgi:hypothetical protein
MPEKAVANAGLKIVLLVDFFSATINVFSHI